MIAMKQKNEIVPRLLWGMAVLLAIAALVLYAHSGAQPIQLLWVWAAGAAALYLPGTLLLRALRCPTRGPLRFVLCTVLGMSAFALLTVLACLTGWHALVPCGVGAVFLAWLGIWLCRLRKGESLPKVPASAPLLAVLCAVYVLGNALWSIRYTHPADLGSIIPSQDFFWNLGNVQSFLLRFPPEDLRVAGVTVTYHYLTELLQAGFILLTGASAYDTVAFAAYAPVAMGMVGCLYALGSRFFGTESRRAAALAAMPLWLCCASLWKSLAAGGSRFGNMLFVHVVSNINGQATALLALAAFFALLHTLEAECWQAGGTVLTGGILAFYLLTFSKGPQAALLALALTAALAVRLLSLLFARLGRRGTPDACAFCPAAAVFYAAVCIGFWFVYLGLFSAGAGSSMALSLTATTKLHFFGSILNVGQILLGGAWPVLLPVLWLAQSFCMAPAAGLAFGWGGLRDICRLRRLAVYELTLYAAVPGGLLAFYLFDHYSSSQIYFATIAIFCLGVILLRELPALWAKTGRFARLRRAAVALLLAVGLLTALCQGVYLVRSIPETRAAVTAQNKLPLSAQEEEGCLWLAQNMPEDALFATNRMHTGQALEGLSNVYSGLSGRRAYCESIKYALSNMGDQTGDITERYYLMEELFLPETSPERVREICAQCGIAYLLYHPASPGTNTHLQEFEAVYVSSALTVYKVN